MEEKFSLKEITDDSLSPKFIAVLTDISLLPSNTEIEI
jgi:hypothetical protein